MLLYPHKEQDWAKYVHESKYVLAEPKDQLKLFKLSGHKIYTWKENCNDA